MTDVEVTGTLANIGEGISKKNKRFVRLELKETEDTYFAWSPEDITNLNPQIGEMVKITHDGSEYPRVQKFEILEGAPKQTQTKVNGKQEGTDKQVKSFKNGQFRTPDQIMRSTALEAATQHSIAAMRECGSDVVSMYKLAERNYQYIKKGEWERLIPEEPQMNPKAKELIRTAYKEAANPEHPEETEEKPDVKG